MPRIYVAILDVGHGNSAVLVDVDGTTLIDAGVGSAVLEFLEDEGLTDIETVLISHADKDHIAGLVGLLGSNIVAIKEVCLNTDSSKESKIWDDLLFCLDQANKARSLKFHVSLTPNDTGRFDRGIVRIEVLAPSSYLAGKGPGTQDRQGRRLTTNSLSAVIRLVRSNVGVVLFPGDIDDVGLEHLRSSGLDAHADLAVFPHHGGKPSAGSMIAFARKFCQLVSPKVVVFSIGRGLHSTPQPDIVDEVRRVASTARIVCTQLSERCAETVPEVGATHLAASFARGREGRRCCGGSVLVDLDPVPHTVLPLLEAHQAFIDIAAPSAVCRRPI